MTIEDRIRASLGRAAAETPGVELGPEALRARATQKKRRRSVAAGGAIALALAMGGLGLAAGEREPEVVSTAADDAARPQGQERHPQTTEPGTAPGEEGSVVPSDDPATSGSASERAATQREPQPSGSRPANPVATPSPSATSWSLAPSSSQPPATAVPADEPRPGPRTTIASSRNEVTMDRDSSCTKDRCISATPPPTHRRPVLQAQGGEQLRVHWGGGNGPMRATLRYRSRSWLGATGPWTEVVLAPGSPTSFTAPATAGRYDVQLDTTWPDEGRAQDVAELEVS